MNCPLHVPGQDMNSCKDVYTQAKSIKEIWLSARRVGGHVKFVGAKKRPAKDEELNMLVALVVSKDMKLTKRV